METRLEILSFYTCVPKIKIWSATDIIVCHFGLFFALLPQKRPGKSKFWKNEKLNTWRYYHFTYAFHKWQPYDVWFLRHGAQQTECFVVWANFCPFYPTNNLKNQNFEKLKKKLGDLELSYETQSRHDSSRHLNFFSFSIYHRATPQTQWTKQTVKKLNLWGKWLQTKKLG